MGLPPLTVNVDLGDSPRFIHKLDFDTYRTICFDRDFMCKNIGYGAPVLEVDGTWHGRREVRDCSISLDPWSYSVPPCYAAGVREAIEALWPTFARKKATPDLLSSFIHNLRCWISTNIEPVTEFSL